MENQVLQMGSPQSACDLASMPGFRFQPTEEELVGFYLKNMVTGKRSEVELINALDLYHYDPWELPAMAFMQGEREWLFFCPRDKKYPNGARPNRVTSSGYWKATGTDRPVRRAHDARCIGLKKTLVFYTGKAPKGCKTEWIMNEYRLPPNELHCFQSLQSLLAPATSHKLNRREVALCRIYKKPAQNLSSCANLFADFNPTEAPDYALIDSQRALDRTPSNTLHQTLSADEPSGSTPRSSDRNSCGPTSPGSPKLLCLAPRRNAHTDEIDRMCDPGKESLTEHVNITTCSSRDTSNSPNVQFVDMIATRCQTSTRLSASAVKKEKNSLASILYPAGAPGNLHSIGSMFSGDCERAAFLKSSPPSRVSPIEHVSTIFRGEQSAWFGGQPGHEFQPLHPGGWSSNLTTISGIDRLLKASMWSPPCGANLGGHARSEELLNSNNQVNSSPSARQALLQIQEHFQSSM